MARKKQNVAPKRINVIFVEGDADEIIINKLVQYYRNFGLKSYVSVENTHGFPYEKDMRKGLQKLEIQLKEPIVFDMVVCEYDTDVFVNKIQLEPDWKKVEENLKQNYKIAHFCRIEAQTSIEDWILDDLTGLLKALDLPLNTQPKGASGQDKIKNLFKKKNIVYDKNKGKKKINTYLENLDIEKIRMARHKELKEFEELIGVKKEVL